MPLYVLIYGWIAYFDYMGQRLICHHECLALLLYLVEGHKFLFCRKDISCTKYESENEMSIAWKMFSHVICAKF
jgi:hypothetical protein